MKLDRSQNSMTVGNDMAQEYPLTTLFQAYAEMDNPPIIELLNIDNRPVGALYLKELRYKNFIVSETNNSEKYYL